jgi:hypothetical protein
VQAVNSDADSLSRHAAQVCTQASTTPPKFCYLIRMVPPPLRPMRSSRQTALSWCETRPDFLDAAKGGLTEAGYVVLESLTAKGGMALLDKSHGEISVLIVDLILPGYSGHEVIFNVFANQKRCRLPTGQMQR